MPGPLPHTTQIQQMMEHYLDDTNDIIGQSLTTLRHSSQFRSIFKVTLATDAVLAKLSTNRIRPNLKALRSIDLRIPLIVSMGQISIALIELRRFIELCYWSIYFTDHAVEWSHFVSDPKQGFQKNLDNPISYCAHRGMNFYSNYVMELMKDEPSGIGSKAIISLRNITGELNAEVHPGSLASARKKKPPFDDISETALNIFGKTQKKVFLNVLILIAAFNRNGFDKLPAMHRAYFDWLVGAELRKAIRADSFGLQ